MCCNFKLSFSLKKFDKTRLNVTVSAEYYGATYWSVKLDFIIPKKNEKN